jgi:hypothetical protein
MQEPSPHSAVRFLGHHSGRPALANTSRRLITGLIGGVAKLDRAADGAGRPTLAALPTRRQAAIPTRVTARASFFWSSSKAMTSPKVYQVKSLSASAMKLPATR